MRPHDERRDGPAGTPWLTPDQAAARAGVNRSTLYDWMRAGRLPYARVGRYRRVNRDAVDRLLRDAERERLRAEVLASDGGWSFNARMAGDYLGEVSARTVYRLWRDGALPFRMVGGYMRTRQEDLDAFMASSTSAVSA